MAGGPRSTGQGPAIDRYGGDVDNPTKNVNALVAAEKEHGKELRAADERFYTAQIASIKENHESRLLDERRFQDGMRAAESRRLDDLAEQKQQYENRVSDILTVQVKTTSDLISTQLNKVTDNLSAQIGASATQQGSLLTAVGERLKLLEQSRYELLGRASVADPAMTSAIAEMTSAIATLTASRATGEGAAAGSVRASDRTAGVIGMITAAIVALVVVVGAIVSVVVYVTSNHGRPEPVYQAAPPAYQQPQK